MAILGLSASIGTVMETSSSLVELEPGPLTLFAVAAPAATAAVVTIHFKHLLFALVGASTFVAVTSAVFPHAHAGRVLDTAAKNANENMAMARDMNLFISLIKRSIEGRTADDRLSFEHAKSRANRPLLASAAAFSECANEDVGTLNDDGKALLLSRTAEKGDAGLVLRAIQKTIKRQIFTDGLAVAMVIVLRPQQAWIFCGCDDG